MVKKGLTIVKIACRSSKAPLSSAEPLPARLTISMTVYAEPEIAADQAIAETIAVHGEHALGLPIRGTALRPTQHHAPSTSGVNARLNPLADQVTLELGQASHDGAQELAAGRPQFEAKSGLRQDADFPLV